MMPLTEVRHQFEIHNAEGLHLRLAAQFACLASKFKAEVRLWRRDQGVNGKSTLDMLTLAAEAGSRLDLEARGADAEEAVAALTELVTAWSLECSDGQG